MILAIDSNDVYFGISVSLFNYILSDIEIITWKRKIVFNSINDNLVNKLVRQFFLLNF